jgi:hypothetical protein
MLKRILNIVILAALLMPIGCSKINPVTPIMTLGILWYQGEAQKYYATEQLALVEATKNVLNEFKLPIKSEVVEDNLVIIKAGDDDKFKIKIADVRENVSKLSIRVNTFGDKPYAELIFRHVDSQPNVQQFASLNELNDAMEKRPLRLRK